MNIVFNRDPRLCANSTCDVWFTPIHPSQKYHELRCKNDVNNANNKAKYNKQNPIETKICYLDACGMRFLPYRRDQRFCHEKCRSRHHYNNQNLRRRRKKDEIAASVPKRKRGYYDEIDPYHRTEREYMRYNGSDRRMKLVTIPKKLYSTSKEDLTWKDVANLCIEYNEAEAAECAK